MIRAYDKIYLEKARVALGRMLDFAVNDLHYDIADFFDAFLKSEVSKNFEKGNAGVLVGKSGIELVYEVLEFTAAMVREVRFKYAVGRSPEYWAGWALAYYQWETALPFAEIVKYVPIQQIISLYSPYHEMDIRQFVDKMNALYRAAKPDTNLKLLRQKAGITQKELAVMTEIPMRTLQQYEQRQKNINKASAEYLFALAQALCCKIQDLFEIQD